VVAAIRPLVLSFCQRPVHIGSEGRQAHEVKDPVQRLGGRLEEVMAVQQQYLLFSEMQEPASEVRLEMCR